MTAWLRRDSRLSAAGWRHGWTTSDGPDFTGDPGSRAHAERVARLTAATGVAVAAWTRLVHGGRVLRVERPGCQGEADALWTDRPGLAVVGRGADCPLVLVGMAGAQPVWGFAHASWRATMRGIAGALVAAMAAGGGDPRTARVVICPSAGPCCYEVGEEVRAAFTGVHGPAAANFFIPGPVKSHLDLWRANRAQLEEGGLASERIAFSGECTIC